MSCFDSICRGVLPAAGICVLVLSVTSASASAQESLRKVVYGGKTTAAPKKETPRKKPEASRKATPSRSKSTTAKKPSTAARKQVSNGGASTKRRPASRPGWIEVVFESKEPNTQVYLNGNHVGATDAGGVFRRKMTAGTYRVRGVHGFNVVFPERPMELGTDGMAVSLHEVAAKKDPEPPKEQPIVIRKTQAEIEMELARAMSARVIKIFSDYLDVERSASVTVDDWKFAANAAVLGEFQDLSKQQIEAQRKFAAGRVNLAEGDRQQAFANFRLAAQAFPSSPLPHLGIGDAYSASSQWQDARKAYEQARSVGPHLWMVHRRLGDVYRILGERKKAVQSYVDAVKFGDERYETRHLRARAQLEAGSLEAAIPLLEDLSEEKPSAEVHLSLGEAFEMQKRDVAALDHYRKAVELDPNLAAAQYRLARIYFEQREYEKAVEGFDAALKLDGDRKSFPHNDAKEKRSHASSRVRPTSK